jgi:hypothetical protein
MQSDFEQEETEVTEKLLSCLQPYLFQRLVASDVLSISC